MKPITRQGLRRDWTRLHCLAGICVLVLAASASAAQPPNVLLISIDTLRADHLGSYGYTRDTTPDLDRFAAQGARFSNAYSQASSTVPSHASLFTGRYPFQHQTYSYRTPLPAAERTLAEVLGEHGYRRFAITSSIRFLEESGFQQGFEHFETLRSPKNKRSAQVIERAKAQIERDPDRPFFGFLHFFDPHEPYTPPRRLEKRWHPGVEGLSPKQTASFLQAHRNRDQAVDPNTLEYLVALYDSEILDLDGMLGEFLQWLTARPDKHSTLVVLTSDHGEEFKEHGGLSHAHHVHEELVRVPLIFHWPGHIPAGSTIQTPAQGVDIFPTVLDLLEIARPLGLPGRSFAQVLAGGEAHEPSEDPAIVVAQQNPAVWAVSANLGAGRFKLTSRAEHAPVLYYLSEDPLGHRNVAQLFPAEASELAKLAEELGVSAAIQTPREAPPMEVSEETLNQLRALGYAEEVEAGLPDPQAPAP